jgi:hypothetical protein
MPFSADRDALLYALGDLVEKILEHRSSHLGSDEAWRGERLDAALAQARRLGANEDEIQFAFDRAYVLDI